MKTRCRKCNQYFWSDGTLGQNKCPDCAMEEEQQFNMVRELVKLNPGISIAEVAAQTGLTNQAIRNYITKLNNSY